MRFGLSDKSYSLLLNALKQFSEIETAKIFGSRAMGNYKPGSDVDIVIYGENVTTQTVFDLSTQLNAHLPTPYQYDVLNYSDISSPELKKYIDCYGLLIEK